MRFVEKNSVDEFAAELIAERYSVTSLVAELLCKRGYDELTASAYLFPTFDEILSPFEFDAMEEVCLRIEQALRNREKIAVYADYDTDGICAAAIMHRTLKLMGGEPIVYIPDRFTEGYGTNERAIRELCTEASLIITVDCGIRSVSDVALARSMGVDVIIADHHECGELPDTPYILNPKREGENYPFKHLCGAGIAFQIAYAMLEDELTLAPMLELAALATIADMVPLVQENRVIASCGLAYMNEQPIAGIKALMNEVQLGARRIKSYEAGYVLSPRINAAGRMANGRIAFEMLATDDIDIAAEQARKLCELNMHRQDVQHEAADKCTKYLADKNLSQEKIIIVTDESFEEGVVGLAAGTLAERFNRPAVVLKDRGETLVGSARSIDGVDIYKVLNSCADLFLRFGGHEQAAGLTIEKKNLQEFKARANQYINEHYTNDVFVKKVYYDVKINPATITLEDAEGISLMEPFGIGNERPAFYIEGAGINAVRRMGREDKHAKFRVNDALNAVQFNAPTLGEDTLCDITGDIDINEYMGKQTLQFKVDKLVKRTAGEMSEDISFVRYFLKEVAALNHIIENISEYNVIRLSAEFKESLIGRNADPLGMVVSVGTQVGAAMYEALELDGIEVVIGEPDAYSAENAVVIHASDKKCFKNYKDIYCIGDMIYAKEHKDSVILINSGLYKAYLNCMESFFVEKAQLRRYYNALLSCEPDDNISSMLMKADNKSGGELGFNKLWYCFNVFREQKLIDVKKSDKIVLISNKKIGAASATQAAFEKLLKKE